MGRKIKSFKVGHVRFVVPRRSAENIWWLSTQVWGSAEEYELESSLENEWRFRADEVIKRFREKTRWPKTKP